MKEEAPVQRREEFSLFLRNLLSRIRKETGLRPRSDSHNLVKVRESGVSVPAVKLPDIQRCGERNVSDAADSLVDNSRKIAPDFLIFVPVNVDVLTVQILSSFTSPDFARLERWDFLNMKASSCLMFERKGMHMK